MSRLTLMNTWLQFNYNDRRCLYPCYTYTRPQYDLKIKPNGLKPRENGVVVVATYRDLFTKVIGRVRTSLIEMASQNFEPTQKIEKPSRPAIRRSAIVLKTRSYCERNCRTAIVLRTFWDVVRSSCC